MVVAGRAAPTPPALNIPRNRDAHAAIAGYVYQVDLTILRWIELREPELLELEAGEDIDKIGAAIADTTGELLRTLEQVKLRTSAITLRAPGAIEALANAAETRAANPGARIQFRFTTTASIGIERPSPWPERKKQPGISLWEALRSKSITESRRMDAERAIVALAATWKRPATVPIGTWSTLLSAMGPSHEGVLALVPVFEWATGAQAPEELRTRITERLFKNFGVPAPQAQAAYERLFHRVFIVLSAPGRKQLRLDTAMSELANIQQSAPETETFQRVIALLKAQGDALGSLSRNIDALAIQQNQLIGPDSKLETAISYIAADVRLNMAPPPRTSLSIERSSVAATILDSSRKAIWIALSGMSGSGKTQLACDISNGPSRWVRLDGASSDEASKRIDACLMVDSAQTQTGFLVFDDLPNLTTRLQEQLVRILTAPPWPDFRLLSTSHQPLPARIKALLPDGIVTESVAPPFTIQETARLATAYGAPEAIQTNVRFMGTLNAWCKGHPQLLAATCRFLQKRSWLIDDDAMNALLAKQPLRELSRETAHIIKETIQDSEARRLLYRAKLSSEPLGFPHLAKLAKVAPVIDRARERVDTLIGPWLRPEVDDKLAVSPLVRELPDDYLDEAERRDCHEILATVDLETRHDQWGLISAFSHYFAAAKYEQAALLQTRGLLGAIKFTKQPPGIDLLLGMWPAERARELPPDIHLMLLAAQTHARHRFGQPTDEQLAEIEVTLPSATPAGSLAAASMAFRTLFQLRPSLAEFVWRRVQNDSRARNQQAAASMPPTVPIQALIWICAQDLSTVEHFDVWVNMTAHLPTDPITWQELRLDPREAMSGPIDRLWLQESEKGLEWQKLLRSLQRVHDIDGVPRDLRARAVRAEIIVRAQKLAALGEAEELAQRTLQDAEWAPEHRFLIAEGLGREQLYAGNTESAFDTLVGALDQAKLSAKAEPIELAMTLRATAVAALRLQKTDAAITFSAESVQTVRDDPTLPEVELVRNLGEAGLIAYLARDAATAYSYLAEGAERHMRQRPDKRLTSVSAAFGRVVEHTYHLATTGAPPDATKLGFALPEPTPDVFYQQSQGPVAPEIPAIVCIRLATIVDHFGDQDRAVTWATQACAEAYESSSASMSKYLYIALQYLTLSRENDAINVFCRELAAAAASADDKFQDGLLLQLVFWLQRLARDCLVSRKSAVAAARQLADECRTFAPSTPHAPRWRQAADFIEAAIAPGTLGAVIADTNKLIAAGDNVMGLLGRAAALLAEDLSPSVAVRLQMAVFDNYPYASAAPAYTQQVLLPYVKGYWGAVASRQSFLLNHSQSLREAIARVDALSAWDACLLLLMEAADAVGVQPPKRLSTVFAAIAQRIG